MQNLVAVSHTICAHVGPKMFGGCCDAFPWDGAWLTPRNMLLRQVFYHTNCCCFRSNYLVVCKGSQKIGGMLGLQPLGTCVAND